MSRLSSVHRRLLVAAPWIAALAACDPAVGESPKLPGLSQEAAPPAGQPGQASTPKLSGPVTGGKFGAPFTAMPKSLQDEYGYVEEEFFIEGSATAYAGALPADGLWSLQPATSAAFKTRFVVRRPKDAARFSGAVLVEWFNVTGGVDADADFRWMYREILRAGDVYVGVSAQRVGVEGGGFTLPGLGGIPLKSADPARYGALVHPGDQYSYDIFSQVGRALRSPTGPDPLHGLQPKQLIAAGESQSAARMLSYVNGVHPRDHVYDGFLIHSRGAGATDFGPSSPIVGTQVVRVRTDLEQPVLQVETETDLLTLGFLAARQPDAQKLRTWEIAGSAHAEAYLTQSGFDVAPGGAAAAPSVTSFCPNPNDSHQTFVLRRALSDLRTWIASGKAPASSPLLETEGNALKRDAHGNALGGIRTPVVDVPTATLSGLPAAGAGSNLLCGLFGSRLPFDANKLRALYPSHADYVAAVTRATDAAIAAGFVLDADKAEILMRAEREDVPPK